MTDRIFLRQMAFLGRHGVTDEEREEPQHIEVDIEIELDLRAAGRDDDLAQTVDYVELFEACRQVVEEQTFRLLEGIAERIAQDVLQRQAAAQAVTVEVRKPGVPIDGVLEHAGVAIARRRG